MGIYKLVVVTLLSYTESSKCLAVPPPGNDDTLSMQTKDVEKTSARSVKKDQQEYDYNTKYEIKDRIKYAVQKLMCAGRNGLGTNDCSTPMVGKPFYPKPLSQSTLISHLCEQGDDIFAKNEALRDKYVTKYFNKYTYCDN